MTDPTPLSPAAQAVLDAFLKTPGEVPMPGWNYGRDLAAALRAAAEGAMRKLDHWNGSMPDDYDCGWNDGLRCLLAIAAELEGANG